MIMKTKSKDILFSLFGCACKGIFHLLGFIAAYKWSVSLFVFLLSILIVHNIVSLLFIKHRTGHWQAKSQILNLKS